MPKSKKLQKQIEKKLNQLSELLYQLEEAHIINSDDSDTWDSDTLYNLLANCKEIIKLLEDKESSQETKGKETFNKVDQKDEFGDPIVLEEGLLSLMDEYQEEEEDNEDY